MKFQPFYFNSIEDAKEWLDPDDRTDEELEYKFYKENDKFHEWENWVKDGRA